MHTTDAYRQHHADRTARLQHSLGARRNGSTALPTVGAAVAGLLTAVTARPRAPLPGRGGRAVRHAGC